MDTGITDISFIPFVQFCHLEVLSFSYSFLWVNIYLLEVERIHLLTFLRLTLVKIGKDWKKENITATQF